VPRPQSELTNVSCRLQHDEGAAACVFQSEYRPRSRDWKHHRSVAASKVFFGAHLTIPENVDEGFTVCDLNGEVLYSNPAVRELRVYASLDKRRLKEVPSTFELSSTDGTLV
jgi:hypothetical protein